MYKCYYYYYFKARANLLISGVYYYLYMRIFENEHITLFALLLHASVQCKRKKKSEYLHGTY